MTKFIKNRDRAYYSKNQIRRLITSGKINIPQAVQEKADNDFGWDTEQIKKAILRIPLNCCYKSEQRYNDPEIWVDYYRARNIYGENVYTHFYVENDTLIIDSFKEL